MSFEVDKLFEEYQRNKFRQFDQYNSRAQSPVFNSIVGYVADVDDMSRLRNTYNIIVPSLNNIMLRQVPRKIPDGFINANGVGHLPAPLRPGQPVLISFTNNSTSLPYIDGSFMMNGQLELWEGDKIPQLDTKDTTNLALFPTPLPPEALAIKGDAEVKVHPLVLRLSSPTQPQNSATALEVPGTTYITDAYGNVFTYFAGERIVVGKNEQKAQAGARQSMADMPKQESLKKAIRLQAQMLESMAHWRVALAGEFTIQTPHPEAKRKRNFNNDTSGSLSISSSGISGQFQTQIGGTEFLKDAFNKMDQISSLLDLAIQSGNKQLNFLQKVLLPLIRKLKTLWGSASGFGLQQLSFSVDLPFNLKLSVSIRFDVKTGKLSIKASIGFGSGTPIVGSQPLPLRSEGTIIAGGYQRQENPQIVVRTTVSEYVTSTIYQDFPELEGYTPQNLNHNHVPYEYVSRDFNNLNFGTNQEDALTSLLTQYGVRDSYLIIRYLVPLVKYGSAFDFLKIAAVLADPLLTIIITVGLAGNDAFSTTTPSTTNADTLTQLNPELEEVVSTIIKPGIVQCPTLPDEAYRILFLAQRGDLQGAKEFTQEYFNVLTPDYISWVEDLENFMDWANANQHPFYPALYQLHDGNLLNFFVLLLYLKTGIDIRAFPRAYDELRAYSLLAFPQPRLGAE